MSLHRTNPDLLNLSNINKLVIPPPKGYPFFKDAEQHSFDADITTYSNINAWWMAEFATLIYKPETSIKDEIAQLTAPTVLVNWIENKASHTQCFVAELKDYTVVSFRGTELIKPSEVFDMGEINDFIKDLLTISDIGGAEIRGVNVHNGILNALNSVWNQLHPILNNTTKPVYFTGHSLGGALALLAAFKWGDDLDGRIGGVYTIGCPAIGDSAFKKKYNNELQSKTFHHIYGEDLVTNLGQIIGSIQQVGNKINLPRVDINWLENSIWLLQMPLIDHAPIFYLNSLWNNMQE